MNVKKTLLASAIFLSASLLSPAHSLFAQHTQIQKSSKVQENIKESSYSKNGKTIREQNIQVDIAGDYEEKTYSHAFKCEGADSVYVTLQSTNASLSFQILEGSKIISPTKSKSWKMKASEIRKEYILRVPLDLSDGKNILFKISIRYT
jgi:hypothetical protein